jgi:hypothetical protein
LFGGLPTELRDGTRLLMLNGTDRFRASLFDELSRRIALAKPEALAAIPVERGVVRGGHRRTHFGRGYFGGACNGADVAVKDAKRYAATGGWILQLQSLTTATHGPWR